MGFGTIFSQQVTNITLNCRVGALDSLSIEPHFAKTIPKRAFSYNKSVYCITLFSNSLIADLIGISLTNETANGSTREKVPSQSTPHPKEQIRQIIRQLSISLYHHCSYLNAISRFEQYRKGNRHYLPFLVCFACCLYGHLCSSEALSTRVLTLCHACLP